MKSLCRIRITLPRFEEHSLQWLSVGYNDHTPSDEEEDADTSVNHFLRALAKQSKPTTNTKQSASVRFVGTNQGHSFVFVLLFVCVGFAKLCFFVEMHSINMIKSLNICFRLSFNLFRKLYVMYSEHITYILQ